MSPINISNVTRVEIGGVDVTEYVSNVDLGEVSFYYDTTPLVDLPPAGETYLGGLRGAEISFSIPFCRGTPETRCWWLKWLDPKRYARLRRMRYETRRRRKHR